MNEKHPTNDNSKTPESEMKLFPAELMPQDKLSRLLKDAITSSNWYDFFKNILEDEFVTTPETVACLLDSIRKNLEENAELDAYNLIYRRTNIDLSANLRTYFVPDVPGYQELKNKIRDYAESFLKYDKKLGDRQKAIHDLFHSIDLIDDPVVKEAVSQKCDNLLDLHEEIAFLQYSLHELRFKVEKEKLKQSLMASCGQDDPLLDEIIEINDNITSLIKSAISQEEKLEQLHDLSKASIIRQEEIKGELSPGGIRFLKAQAAKLPEERLVHIIKALTKSGITEEMWKLFWMNQEGMNNYAIAERMGVDQSTIYRKIKELRSKLHNIGGGDLLVKYGTTKKKTENALDRSGAGEYSRKASRQEDDDTEE